MGTFKHRFRVTIDDQVVEMTSRPADFLVAERAMAREKISNPQETAPLQLQMRICFAMFSRNQPEHPAARDWPKFLDIVEDIDDLDASEEPLTPTLPADTENSP